MRWADLDTLNHVNNVRYIDYALEASAQLRDDGVLPDDHSIARMEVDFLRPLMLSGIPARITSTASDPLVQEICAGDDVFARVTTTFGPSTAPDPDPASAQIHEAQLRRGDLGSDGAATPAKIFELFQESRILHFSGLMGHENAGRFVVAHLAVDFIRPITWRPEPLSIASRVTKVGNSSLRVGSQIVDASGAYATCDAVLVGFDMATQSSRRFSDEERAHLQSVLEA